MRRKLFWKLISAAVILAATVQCGSGIFFNSRIASFSASFPTLSHKYYANPDAFSLSSRTVTFSHDGAYAECSSDAGVTFGDCTSSTTLVWTGANYNVEHIIRVWKKGGKKYEYSFTPSTQFPSKIFLDCDQTVSANESFDTFEARLATANRVVCISAGVTITNSGAEDRITIGANGVKILGDYDDATLEIDNGRTAGATLSDSGIYATSKTGVVLSGISIEVDGTNGYALYFDDSDSYYFENLKLESNGQQGIALYSVTSDGTIDNCTINADQINSQSIFLTGGATVSITDSTISSNGGTFTVYISSTSAHTVTIDNCTITATSTDAIYTNSSTDNVTITNSTLTTTGTSYGDVTVARGTVTISNSTLTNSVAAASSFAGLYMIHSNSNLTVSNSTVNMVGAGKCLYQDSTTAPNTATFNSVTFKRTNSGASSATCLHSDAGSAINSTSNNNLFCHENASITFTAVLGGNGVGTGNFDINAQQNGGAVVACP